jgi:Right handed beta helix region
MFWTWFRTARYSNQSRVRLSRSPARFRPAVEVLETRDLPNASPLLVTTAADSGPGSLRAAITSASGTPGASTIDFDIASGIQRIHLQSPLPSLVNPVTLDGSTQPGFSSTPLIVLDGTFAGPSANGLVLTGGSSTVRDLVIHGFGGSGVVLSGPGDDVVSGDYIGTDVTGTLAFPNGERGVYVNGSSNNTIGGSDAGSGDVISSSDNSGILIVGGSNNVIQGDKIGTDMTGTKPLGNEGFGIRLDHATQTQIGGTSASARNIISGNERGGIFLDVGSTGNVVQGNYIGTDVTGTVALANNWRGIDAASATNNTIGGTAAGASNVISGNLGSGVVLRDGTSGTVVQHNFIGTDVTGTHALANGYNGVLIYAADNNTIGGTAFHSGNLISGNTKSGIDIDADAFANVVEGNYVGTDITGTASLGNGQRGILISGASNNEIGGTSEGSGNVISGNEWAGVLIDHNSLLNQVQGNFIGTDKTGTQELGNGASGIRIARSSNNLVGGTVAGSGNVISGNDQDGVWLDGDAFANLVQGNSIGTDIGGTLNLGNKWNGVAIGDAGNNTIGGSVSGAANTITNNLGDGVLVDGSQAVGNTVSSNTMFANNVGIVLMHGGNDNAATPMLGTCVIANNTATVDGTMAGAPNTTYTLDFYSNTGTDVSGHAEGQTYLGSGEVMTNSKGIGSFNVSLGLGGASAQSITATATDSLGNTSAFSTAAMPETV